MNNLKSQEKFSTKIASVDIPSGWDVDQGNVKNIFTPDLLISLTLPKLCSKEYKGIHYLGGRFVPLYLYEKFNIQAPTYPGSEMIKKIN
jgi:NAD(P)H-hydrate epimerase